MAFAKFDLKSGKYVDKHEEVTLPAMIGCTLEGAESWYVLKTLEKFRLAIEKKTETIVKVRNGEKPYENLTANERKEKKEKLEKELEFLKDKSDEFAIFYGKFECTDYTRADMILAIAQDPSLASVVGLNDTMEKLFQSVDRYLSRYGNSGDEWTDDRKHMFSDVKRFLLHIHNDYSEGEGLAKLTSRDVTRFIDDLRNSLKNINGTVKEKKNLTRTRFTGQLALWLVWMYTGKQVDVKEKKTKKKEVL